MTSLRDLEKKRNILLAEAESVQRDMDAATRRRRIRCNHCGKLSQIGKLVYIQSYWYEMPYGCTGGDRWLLGEGRFRCGKGRAREEAMSAVVDRPSVEAIERVRAWEAEQAQVREERHLAMRAREACPIHGHQGRMIHGPAPYGYGPTCRRCRREWSRKHGRPWESEEQARKREQRGRGALRAEIEAMPPYEFYAAFEALRQRRYEATRRYHHEAKPDEFGVNCFGSATPDGERYCFMRDRVWAERQAFARDGSRP